MLARMWSNSYLRSLLLGMQSGTVILEDSSAISYKAKYSLTLQSSNHTPQCLSKWVENGCPHTNLHTNIYGILFSIYSQCYKAKNRRQPRCSWIGEGQTNYGTSIQWDYHSTVKINEISSHKMTHRNFKSILLN